MNYQSCNRLPILIATALCLALSTAAMSGEIANDRNGIVIMLSHDLTDRPYHGNNAHDRDTKTAARRSAFSNLSSFDAQIVPLPNQPSVSSDVLPATCRGSIDDPSLGVPNDGYVRGVDSKIKRFSHFPCYAVPTIQYVENRLSSVVPSYYSAEAAKLTEEFEREMLALKNENIELRELLTELSKRMNELEKDSGK